MGALLGTVLLVKHLLHKLEDPSLDPQELRKLGWMMYMCDSTETQKTEIEFSDIR